MFASSSNPKTPPMFVVVAKRSVIVPVPVAERRRPAGSPRPGPAGAPIALPIALSSALILAASEPPDPEPREDPLLNELPGEARKRSVGATWELAGKLDAGKTETQLAGTRTGDGL